MIKKINLFVNIILFFSAITITYIVIKKELFNNEKEPTKIDNFKSYLRNIRTSGNPQANIKIIFFSNYQCPYCKKVNEILKQLIHERNDIQIIYYEYPNEASNVSFNYAKVAICADKFNIYDETKNILYNLRNDKKEIDWEQLARFIDVNKDTLIKCFNSSKTEDILFNDILTGKKIKIRYTPTLIINGYLVEGLLPKEDLVSIIEKINKKEFL